MSEAAKKHLRVSPLIFKYVLREFMIPLVCALAAFAFLFLVNNVFDDLPDFMSKNVPIRVVMAYFLSLQPHNLLNVIPISVLLAASFMTVMMGRNNELCAMRAAGMSLLTCALPVWLVACVACVCAICIGEFWGPAGLHNASRIRREWLDNKKKDVETVAVAAHLLLEQALRAGHALAADVVIHDDHVAVELLRRLPHLHQMAVAADGVRAHRRAGIPVGEVVHHERLVGGVDQIVPCEGVHVDDREHAPAVIEPEDDVGVVRRAARPRERAVAHMGKGLNVAPDALFEDLQDLFVRL